MFDLVIVGLGKDGHILSLYPGCPALDARERWVEVETWEGDARARAEPFDALEVDLAALWARSLPELSARASGSTP